MYEQTVQTAYPGLLLMLIDQSLSMSDPYGPGKKKMDFAALAINRCIYEIINSCIDGDEIKNRCQIGVYGYGAGGARLLVGGWAADVDRSRIRVEVIPRGGGLSGSPLHLPIFVEPKAEGGTPMNRAFDMARELVENVWLPHYPDSFPPIVINITDGQPDDIAKATQSAQALTSLRSDDGNVLLFNAHISEQTGKEFSLPSSLPRWAQGDTCAEFLFNVSSRIPPQMYSRARDAGLDPENGAKGCLYRADAEMLTKLIVFGSKPMSNSMR